MAGNEFQAVLTINNVKTQKKTAAESRDRDEVNIWIMRDRSLQGEWSERGGSRRKLSQENGGRIFTASIGSAGDRQKGGVGYHGLYGR
jgi:hypothetical protein